MFIKETNTSTPPRAEFANIEFWDAGARYRPFGQEARDLSLLGFDMTTRKIVRSVDDGRTWQEYASHYFDIWDWLRYCHHLPNGEIVVASELSNGTVGPRVWVSSGWANPATATFTQTLTATPDTVFRIGSFSADRNVILVSEYGKQTKAAHEQGVNPAVSAYLSRDAGQSFVKVFDLTSTLIDGQPAWGTVTRAQHLHGAGYDAAWDRLWLMIGDVDTSGWGGRNGIIFSDDDGATWTSAFKSTNLSWQSVGCLPLRNAVVFGSDGHANGLRRIGRLGHRDGTPVTAGHVFDYSYGIQVITTWFYKAPGVPDAPALFAFQSIFKKYPGGVVVSLDEGDSFHTVWRDPNTQETALDFKGPVTVLGPTNTGRFVVHADDTTRYPTGSMMVADLVVTEAGAPPETLQVGAEAFTSVIATASGPKAPDAASTTYSFPRWGFTADGTQAVLTTVAIPDGWKQIRVEVLYSVATAEGGGIQWQLHGGFDFSKVTGFGFRQVTAPALGVANDPVGVAAFLPIDVRGRSLRLRIERLPANVYDTYPGQVNLHAVRIVRVA